MNPVNDKEQERRFHSRLNNPEKRRKPGPVDIESRNRRTVYTMAKDSMFVHTDSKQATWYVAAGSCDKKRARPKCSKHLSDTIADKDLIHEPINPERRENNSCHVRPPVSGQSLVPEYHSENHGES